MAEPIIKLHQHDLPSNVTFTDHVSIDTEAMGLNMSRDRMCLVQLCSADKVCHLIQIHKDTKPAPNLIKVLKDKSLLKIFHYARFDVAMLYKTYNKIDFPKNYIDPEINDISPIYCTKIASNLCRTYSDRHSLKELCRVLLKIDLQKTEQVSDWGHTALTYAQQRYAASDVLYLNELRLQLDPMLARENRTKMFRNCCDFLSTRAQLDIVGWPEHDIFAHHVANKF